MDENYFDVLNNIDVSSKVEKKNGLSYLSWAFAWGELKKKFPHATYKIYENNEGWNYFTDGRTCWVKTGVTVEEIEHIEYLPVMDFRNAAIKLDKITSTDVNKAIQRSLTKACARHGVGLYVYAGEDLPEKVKEEKSRQEEFDSRVKADLKKTIKEYSDFVGSSSAQTLSFLEVKYGKYNTWDTETMINAIDYLKKCRQEIEQDEEEKENKGE